MKSHPAFSVTSVASPSDAMPMPLMRVHPSQHIDNGASLCISREKGSRLASLGRLAAKDD